MVTDGLVGWLGGHNVGDGRRRSKFGHWHDVHVRIEGPAFSRRSSRLLEDWRWATGHDPEVQWIPKAASDDVTALIIPTGPADDLETANLMFVHAINTARKRSGSRSRILFQDHSMIINSISQVTRRGCSFIPDEADHWLVYMAAYSYFEAATQTVRRCTDTRMGFCMQKVMLARR
ncbi:MAG: hypothetical protein R3A47_00445 [Polyangiales bacterium]